ncbi:Hypothetical protein FKW44_013200 [Caligus rogercresseyi]|uniref:Uncharacterized protein n=1 Tax=Caligus rogercresseyi TaxID=217165 RepID=A0A7T8HKS8_CALRO|nr:Hypothetical protein FKW44_018460 [Caligus rogercresseyi]QQP51757.1 Hypothetical protein FKW44_013200 [Caligus rogercresseyi]
MQNELNTNKYFKLAYSANRCRCAVNRVPGASSSRNFRRGEPSPVPLRRPSREKSASEGS